MLSIEPVTDSSFEALTIHAALPALLSALAAGRNTVLAAPPGSGKSTAAPLALLTAPWLNEKLNEKKILLLEPRRVAARAIAARLAHNIGSPLGQTVGYRIRQDSRCGPATRIEVITEGILTRMLQHDAALTGVGLVIFDEFHERSLHADLGLALCLESQTHLRDDLRLLVMSATLQLPRLLQVLDTPAHAAACIEGGSTPHPVTYRWLGRPARTVRIEAAMIAATQQALRETTGETLGDILAFLPGAAEIRHVTARLSNVVGADVQIHPLYGDLEFAAQERALQPAPAGIRKVILATDIAQTSLTVAGVHVVIDSGLARVPRFDPVSGMTRLLTINVSRASATQRAGRAGRTAPGTCYRLWDADQHERLAEFDEPEIRAADLLPLVLELAAWGEREPGALRWLDLPNSAAWAQAVELLQSLGALDDTASITGHGRAMHALAAHPRLSHMLIKANELGQSELASLIAALLQERDPLRRVHGAANIDLEYRIRLLIGDQADSATDRGLIERSQLTRLRTAAKRYQQQLKATAPTQPVNGHTTRLRLRDAAATRIDATLTGQLLALAYPERIARRRPGGEPRFQLASGRGASCASEESLAHEPWLAIAHLDGEAREARIFLAAAIASPADIPALANTLQSRDVINWDHANEAVVARRERRLGAILLDERPLTRPTAETLRAAMRTGIRAMGLGALPWHPALRQWLGRVLCLRHTLGDRWPDVSDAALLESLDTWLDPWLDGITRRAHLLNIDLHSAVHALLPLPQQRALDRLAPTHLLVPSGSNLVVDYSDPAQPALAVKVQEVFGWRESPRIADDRIAVALRLLSPGQQPVQITRDLASFWANGYAEVRKDLRGRYPRHPWPEDPLTAIATKRAKPRGT